MSIVVDHKNRRREILRKSQVLFAEQGYAGVTFQQVADSCGLARTYLYKYFRNKREIFDGMIGQLVKDLATEFNRAVSENPGLRASDKLELVMSKVTELMYSHAVLLQSIVEYLSGQRRCGDNVARKVRRHTVALRRTLVQLVREGVAAGEFGPMQCHLIGDVLYGVLEAAALRIAITDTACLPDLLRTCRVAISCLKKGDPASF